ncbi:hypothetical protein [Paracoccus sp. S3-43]|uniref:hypothetical protein n=1 Tax=Paracoccus sp. S3-43 TaxID=3030011 RepID=UPI0023AFD16F|nr:hypothetical protein [Paracoccus sp. S3-43]WEF23471.1 hypothetical protein PXD02_11700 [Paracoccus sp. S3-43]
MRALVLLLILCACASPSPRMLGALRHDVRLEGIDFAVFHKDEMAEFARMTFVARPWRRDIPALMVQAAAQATGCEVIAFSGKALTPRDTGVLRFDLDCWGALSRRPDS